MKTPEQYDEDNPQIWKAFEKEYPEYKGFFLRRKSKQSVII